MGCSSSKPADLADVLVVVDGGARFYTDTIRQFAHGFDFEASVKAMHRGTYELGWTRRTVAVSFCVADQADMPTTESLVERNGYDHVYQPWFLQEGYLDGCTPGSRRFWERFCAVYSGSWPREYCDGLEDELRGYFWPPSAAPLPRL